MMQHLINLQKKHQSLEKMISDEYQKKGGDDLSIRRLKREKLHLKEQIERTERMRGTA